MGFTNKTAIVTGAGQGIGFEICSKLVSQGAKVILNDIDSELAENAAKKIRVNTKGNCISLPGDSSDPIFIQQLVTTAVENFGQLNIVIANAGNGAPGKR